MRIIRSLLLLAIFTMLATPAGFARQATPEAGAGLFQERFLSLAGSMPDWLDRDEATIAYTDLAWRAEAVGINLDDDADGLIDVSVGYGLPVPPAFMFASLFPELGFTSAQVHRTLVTDAFGDKVTLMDGAFDFDSMSEAMLASGYVEDAIGGVPVFVFGGDDHLDLDGGAGTLAFTGKTHYVIVLSEGRLGFTNKRAWAEQIIAAHLGEGSSLAMNDDVQALVTSARTDLVSAEIWSLAALKHPVSAGEPEELMDLGEMPAFQRVLFGDSAGTGWYGGPSSEEGGGLIAGDADAAGIIVLLMEDATQAEVALEVVPARFDALSSIRTSEPYPELLTLKSAEIGASPSVAVFAFDVPISGRLSQMWLAQDLRFVYPG